MNRELILATGSVKDAIESQIKSEPIKLHPVVPISSPVLAQPHTPVYKMHRYYARRPHNVFSKLIKSYSNPGEIILDPFCGGGVTVVEGLKLRRKVIGIDLNPLATWITKNEVEPINIDLFEKMFKTWYGEIYSFIEKLFEAKCTKCESIGIADWFEWSNVVICPNCGNDIILGSVEKIGPGKFQCANAKCKAQIEPNKCTSKEDVILSVKVSCKKCEISYERQAIPSDNKSYLKIEKDETKIIRDEKLKIPRDRFPDMDRARDDNVFGRGVKYFTDLMTSRQRIAYGFAKKLLPKSSDKYSAELDAIYHLFSASLRYGNKFVFRSPGWQSGQPIEWAGHNYWLPFNYIELNPLSGIGKRFNAILAGKTDQLKHIGNFYQAPKGKNPWKEFNNGATCWLLTQSSHDIPVPSNSVQAIITDPPFGGNVQYGELSDFYLVWSKDYLNLKNGSEKQFEAIETRNQDFDGAKDRDFYEDMLFKVFKECRRVIKKDGWLVLTFHNKDIGVWMSLHRAALRAGFRLPSENESVTRGMVYQPPVQNYTQTIHQRAAGSMLGDFILSFKPVAPPVRLAAIKSQISVEEEKQLKSKMKEIIHYHGGADETTLMTGLIPYLHEQALLHRIAKYGLKDLLTNGEFIFSRSDKKWYTNDMVEESGTIKVQDVIPAEAFVQELVHSYLKENKHATMDDLLVLIYEHLVNSHRPQISTIDKVISKYCVKKKLRGTKRDVYIWNPRVKTPIQIQEILSAQTKLVFDSPISIDHDSIILFLSQIASQHELNVHVGETEQRKTPDLHKISSKLSGFELGLSPEAFKLIKEIDLIILRGTSIACAVEVTTSITTFNKAVNDRFRNLLTIVPNLKLDLYVILRDQDFERAYKELYSPANVSSRLAQKVKLIRLNELKNSELLKKIHSGSFTK